MYFWCEECGYRIDKNEYEDLIEHDYDTIECEECGGTMVSFYSHWESL